LRSALAHAGAGRLDIAERLLTRVARTGGRSGDGDFGELARQLGRVLAQSALGGSALKPSPAEALRLKRLLLDLSHAETGSIILVRAEAGAPELKVRLAASETDKTQLAPDVAAGSLGLYLFRTSSGEPPAKLLERLTISGPSELAPSRPIRLRVDVLPSGGPSDAPRLATRELTLPSDGKLLALAP
jgi:hypothetical protein